MYHAVHQLLRYRWSRGAVRPGADDRLTTGLRQGSVSAGAKGNVGATPRAASGITSNVGRGRPAPDFPTMETLKMLQGSLRRFPLGGVVLAFLVGLLLAGLLNLPGSTSAQQQERPRYAAGAPAAPPPGRGRQPPEPERGLRLGGRGGEAERGVHQVGQAERAGRRPTQPQLQVPPGFEEFFPRLPQMQPPEFQEAAGSGFIVSRDGYILTNDHVVDGSDEVTVRLLDRREFKAKVIGTDPGTDLAVLKIDATNLTPAPLGDSDAARVGEWVLAVGNPLGENLTFTVTSGIISAKGRTLALPNVSDRSIQDFIQTDAAINPGNSGGPLVSTSGRVLGVNSAIASRTGFYSGYGFAIPINLARQVMDQIISHGEVRRSVLGIAVRNASANDAAYVGLPDIRGVLVEDFGTDNSAAKKAGLEAGRHHHHGGRQAGGVRGPAAAADRLPEAGRDGQGRGGPQGRRPQDLRRQAAGDARRPPRWPTRAVRR